MGNHGFTEEQMMKRRRAIADPTRQMIMERIRDGGDRTAKELAGELGVGVNGLYYHLRILEAAQLVTVSGTRDGTRIPERTYRPATNQLYTWALDEDLVAVLHGNLEMAKREVEERIYDMARRLREDDDAGSWSIPNVASPAFRTSHAEVVEFGSRLDALIDEFRARAKAVASDLAAEELRMLKVTYAVRELPAEGSS